MPVLETEIRNHTLWARIDRPEARNSINFEIMDRLEGVLDTLEEDSSIRTFVLSGRSGDIFISGGDLKEFHGITTAEKAKAMSRRMLDILERIERLPCWAIACVNGAAYGGGCEIMLAFDFRVTSPEVTFGFTQGRFYLPPGWGGLTRLIEQVGRSTALRWIAETAIVDAETARNHKLVDRIEEPEQLTGATWRWADELSHNDRKYIRSVKRGALRFTEARWETIEAELEPFAECWIDERHQQRVEKFLDKKDGREDQREE